MLLFSVCICPCFLIFFFFLSVYTHFSSPTARVIFRSKLVPNSHCHPLTSGKMHQHLFHLHVQAQRVENLPHLIKQVIFKLDSGVACSYCLWRSSMLFSSLLFIFQSKEYPRNVPENPARKFVEKEVCIKWTWKNKTKQKQTQTIMGERSRPCKRRTNNTGERGWLLMLWSVRDCLVLVEMC